MFKFRKMDESTAWQIVGWRYPFPYEIYNCDPNRMDEAVYGFLLPHYCYFAIYDESDILVGFCCFGEDAQVPGGEYGADALDVGAGLRPDLTGQGLGCIFLAAILAFARQRFAPERFRVTVADFNQRALRVWEKTGFEPVQHFESLHGSQPFEVLTGPTSTWYLG